MILYNKNHVKWFTLIELLVVITIIWILAVGAVGIYNSQIKKARDSTRMTDIKAVETAVMQFYQDRSVYPNTGNDWTWTGTSVTEYVQRLPQDPKNWETCLGETATTPTTCAYLYAVWPDKNGINNGAYELSIGFEDQWNVVKFAKDDGWNNNYRYEIWININVLDTRVATFTSEPTTTLNGTTALQSNENILIVRWGIRKMVIWGY
jgi:general secretion pathway protein G